jgi:hypothetical protein
MKKGFKILDRNDCYHDLMKYRENGAIRGVFLGFPVLHELYTISVPGVTDITGYPASGKSELWLEFLLNTSIFYGWNHILYVPDVGDKNEILGILIHKITGKTFDKRFVNSNYITEAEVEKQLDWVLHHFKILYKEDLGVKMTPYEFWDLAAKMNQESLIKHEGGYKTATIDSWKDMKHGVGLEGETFQRDDKYLEDVLSYRNAMSEKHKMHFATIIHPKSGIEKDKEGNRKAPGPDDLKGGSEWWNNGKTMITVHRVDGTPNKAKFIVTKAKPKTVAKQGSCEIFFDFNLNKFYWEYNGEKKYAQKENVKPIGLDLADSSEEDDELPF